MVYLKNTKKEKLVLRANFLLQKLRYYTADGACSINCK